MGQLVAVPYAPQYKGTARAVAKLLTACQIAGHNIPLADGWRSYAEQHYYRNGWELGLPGFNYASDPDDPNAQNNHLRGEAWDIVNRGDRQAMLDAGFTPDPSEWWHFNEPNWRNMPIIKTDDSSTVAGTDTAIPITEDEEMTNKFYIAGVSDSPSTLIFGGPNLVPMPIPNPLWQGVLTDYVNAMNNPDEDAKLKTLSKFSRAQWKLIRQALSNTEPHPELDEAIKKAGY